MLTLNPEETGSSPPVRKQDGRQSFGTQSPHSDDHSSPTREPAQRSWTRTAHLIDYRVTINLPFGGSYYIALFAGPERRNKDRLAREGQTLSSRRALLLIFVLLFVLGTIVFSAAAFLFIIKSTIGLDLMQGESFFHPLYEVFFN